MNAEDNTTTTTTESGLDSELDTDTEETTNGDTAGTTSTNTESSSKETTAGDANTSEDIESNNAVEADESQNAGANSDNQNSSLGTYGTISIIFGVIFSILILACLWKMLEKLGEKGWKVLIPIYNLYILVKVAFLKSSEEQKPVTDEFNFDDNIANINKFNNDNPDYSSSMDQSSRFEPINNEGMGINPENNNDDMGEMPNEFPSLSNMENNNMNEPMGNAQMEMNNMPGMMPNQDMAQEDQYNNPMPNQNMEQNNMPGMMPDENQPAPNWGPNDQYNNGPMPMPGAGPDGMNKQCPNCHAPVPLNLVICPNCGANVGGMN